LHAANIQDRVIRYRWDDWDIERAEEPIDREFYKRLQSLSQRANVALTIATAEWIVQRFAQIADVTLSLQYVEAAWVQVVDFRYGTVPWDDYTNEHAWSGPVFRPIWTAMYRIQFALEVAKDDEEPELRAAWVTNLASYVLTDPTPYRIWLEAVMVRLESLYPRDPSETLGEVVPRVALDPEQSFTIEMTEPLINRFLADIDIRTNPFLASPESLVTNGFDGTPYQFRLQGDRTARFDW